MDPTVTRAIAELEAGRPVLIYDADGREEETDMVILSEHATPERIATMRQDAGGLICTAVPPAFHHRLGLPFMADLLAQAAHDHPVLGRLAPDDIPYDARSSFGVTLNHRDTYTGITDDDRSLTIRELARLVGETETMDPDAAAAAMGDRFRSPGHCILLNGAVGGLEERQGHTELTLALARMTDGVPCTTMCEMMDPTSGKALPQKAARDYADAHGLYILAGQDILDACKEQNPTTPAA